MKVVMDINVVLAAMIQPKGLALLIKALDKNFLINYSSEDAIQELSLKMGDPGRKGKALK